MLFWHEYGRTGIDMDAQQNDGGILLYAANGRGISEERQKFIDLAANLGIGELLQSTIESNGRGVKFRLREELLNSVVPEFNTLQLCKKLQLAPLASEADLDREILLAILSSPVAFEYPGYSEFAASVRIRRNIVKASRLTALAFHTSKIERPEDCWRYSEDYGFTLQPGKSLIEALRKATQPEASGEKYSFSCYRATEYVILLGIAQELAESNPVLLQEVQCQWERRAIVSRQFHDIFMREYGSMSKPLPPKYYVPGDRLWFRNPDERSSEIVGYEGSWVIYLGGGLFTNFWKHENPYTLASKCIEIYHWRSGVFQDAEGQWQMNEAIVEEKVRDTMRDPVSAEHILERMMRLRDPQGIFADGGCLDASREFPRWVCPGSSDLILLGQ
jgi:hypothetical protein